MQKLLTHAQGTIEYLVIISIIVVISLFVVSFVANTIDSTESTSVTSSKISNKLNPQGIVIIDAVSSTITNEGYLNLKNMTGDTSILTKISTEEDYRNYNEILIGNEDYLINIQDLCKCEEGQNTKTCKFTLNFTTKYGLISTLYQKILITCQENITLKKDPIYPTDCFDITKDPINICSLSDLNRIREKLDGAYILQKNIDAIETST